MRTNKEISADLVLARARKYGNDCTNIGPMTVDERAEVTAYGMELDRQIYRLLKEQREWIEAP